MTDTSSVDVALVVRIADAGSLSAAARQLMLSPASVSARLTDIERRLGVPMFRRSTRSLHLMEEGERYLASARPILDMLDAAEDAARGATDPTRMTGSVRLGAPLDLGRQFVGAMVDAFVDAHPRIHVSLLLTDEVTDLRVQNVDLAVRYGDAPSTTGTSVSRLADNRRVICGAPDYLERTGRPRHPDDLRRHNCLCLRTATSYIRRWPTGGGWVEVAGDRSTSDGSLLRSWAIDGRGLVLKSWWDVRNDLTAGRLEEVFPNLPTVPHPLRLARVGGRHAPIRVSRLADHLRRGFRELSER
ncbi:MAG: LysR family transcriptional regulator [Gluconacetobacter diazotrophicus]|nr:LysR family transcriptional regulator [Gluconacetobacter diazotrophicus]